MGMLEYWKKISIQAYKRTNILLHLDSWQSIMVAIIVVIIAVAFIWLRGNTQEAINELVARISLTITLLLIYPFIWLYNLFHEPYKVDQEQKDKILEFEKILQPRLEMLPPIVTPPVLVSGGFNMRYVHIIVNNIST